MPLDGVAHAPPQQRGVDLPLRQVLLRAGVDRIDTERVVVQAGEDDDRHARRTRQRPCDRLQPLRIGQREVGQQQIHVVAVEIRQAVAQGLDRSQLDALTAAVGEILAQQLGVVRIVLDQQDAQRHDELSRFRQAVAAAGAALSIGPWVGSSKKNVVPLPGSDSTQIRPPCRSMIFLQIARPTPVPGYVRRLCNRWKMTKMRSAYSGSMPMPLSRTDTTQRPFTGRAAMCTRGGSWRRNLIALPIRFWNSWRTCEASAGTIGSGSCVTTAPVSATAACRSSRTSRNTLSQLVGSK